MNLAAFFSPMALTAFGVIVLLSLVLFIVDSRRSRWQRNVQRALLAKAKKQNMLGFSVVIELTRSADSIIDLLDHLLDHNYKKLQVVVVVKQTAGKNAVPALRRYQRQHPGKGITILKHRKGMDRNQVAKHHATGQLLMWLLADQRLETRFFERMSLRFVDKTITAVAPRRHITLDTTFKQAVVAWNAIFTDTYHLVTGKAAQYSPSVYRRTAYIAERQNDMIRYDSAISVHETTAPRLLSLNILITGLIAALAIAAIFLPEWRIVIATAAAGYVILNLLLLSATKGYSWLDRVNLILLLPFTSLISLFITKR